jgi:hypothetical protein
LNGVRPLLELAKSWQTPQLLNPIVFQLFASSKSGLTPLGDVLEWCKELPFCQLLTPLGAALRSGVRPLAELE